ncbi:hypothetical protein F4811DRAFT_552743 [Daldinia bambusicola]|nr:hypothetical protein F4811DRAFT_552743 [Daldinia bambusicola]
MRIFGSKIPAELSFESVIRGKSCSPCSLDEFMNYLLYVERSAENLQFFVWYCNYVERWIQLSRSERDRSPAWRPGKRAYLKSGSRSAKSGERVEKLSRILEILDEYTPVTTSETTPEATPANKPESKIEVDISFSKPRAPELPSGIKKEAQDEWQWQPFSAQPFRDEVTQVTRQYISIFGLRKLSLTHEDRTACLHALQHTTHPSSFIAAFLSAETELRKHSHPNFIRWSTCNINSSRILCARALGAVLLVLAVLLNIILIFSTSNRLSRLSAVPFWYVGFYALLIEGRGINLRLYINQKRQLRPWEQPVKSELESADSNPKAQAGQMELDDKSGSPKTERQDTTPGGYPIEGDVQTRGSTDGLSGEWWAEKHRKKSVWQTVFDVPTFLVSNSVDWFGVDTLW